MMVARLSYWIRSAGAHAKHAKYRGMLWRSAIPNEAAVRSKAHAVLAEGVTAAVPVILDVEQYLVDVRLDISHINPETSTCRRQHPKVAANHWLVQERSINA